MEPVRPVTASSPMADTDRPQRAAVPPAGGEIDRQGLDPAVSVELSPAAAQAKAGSEARAYVREDDSQKLVFRITDAVSGDVIVQIPNEIIVKARTYGRQPEPPVGDRVERSV